MHIANRCAYNRHMDHSKIIDELGGTGAVARLCEIQSPSVSEWRVKGIPKARLQFLRVLRPDLFRAAGKANRSKSA